MTWLNECTEVKTPADIAAEEQARAEQDFKNARQTAIDNATVVTGAGHVFDADEKSITRMKIAYDVKSEAGATEVGWVLANSPTGVKTTIPLAELKEACLLAAQNFDAQWGR